MDHALRGNLGRRAVMIAVLAVAVLLAFGAFRQAGYIPGLGPDAGKGSGGSQGTSQGTGGNPATPGPVGSLEPVWHGLWTSFGYREGTFLVIQTEAEWQALWAGAEGPAHPPQVDFGTRTVLVAIHGQAATTGNDIRIAGVTLQASGTYFVSIQATHPGANCATGQALTYPVDMVSIPKASGPFDFQRTDSVLGCP